LRWLDARLRQRRTHAIIDLRIHPVGRRERPIEAIREDAVDGRRQAIGSRIVDAGRADEIAEGLGKRLASRTAIAASLAAAKPEDNSATNTDTR
jgi:hypothetical protein